MTRPTLPGIYRVWHPDSMVGPFNLSVVEVFGVLGYRGYQDHEPRPQKGRHYTPDAHLRQWIDELELIEPACLAPVREAVERHQL